MESRAVGVVSGLISKEEREKRIAKVREEYAQMAASYARGQEEKTRAPLAQAGTQAPHGGGEAAGAGSGEAGAHLQRTGEGRSLLLRSNERSRVGS